MRGDINDWAFTHIAIPAGVAIAAALLAVGWWIGT